MNDVLAALYARLRDEPVLVAAVVSAVLVLLVQFGIPVPDKLDDGLSVLILAVSALIARRKVQPVKRSSEADDTLV